MTGSNKEDGFVDAMQQPWFEQKYDKLARYARRPAKLLETVNRAYPKAIATFWSSPKSACALHMRFGDGNYRGPVRFHMDLDGDCE